MAKMSDYSYWEECVAEAAHECGVVLTKEQLESIASSVQSSHDNYGMAFYSPPSSDRFLEIEREHKKEIKRMEDEHRRELDSYKEQAEDTIRLTRNLLYRAREELEKANQNT